MTLKQTRLVTTDVAKLTRFYETVSQSKAEVLNSSFVQFQNEACRGLAIVELASTRAYGEDVAESGANRSVILDFEVDDVDAEYERLQESERLGDATKGHALGRPRYRLSRSGRKSCQYVLASVMALSEEAPSRQASNAGDLSGNWPSSRSLALGRTSDPTGSKP